MIRFLYSILIKTTEDGRHRARSRTLASALESDVGEQCCEPAFYVQKSLDKQPHPDLLFVQSVFVRVVCISPMLLKQDNLFSHRFPIFLFQLWYFPFFMNFSEFQLIVFITSLSKCLTLISP